MDTTVLSFDAHLEVELQLSKFSHCLILPLDLETWINLLPSSYHMLLVPGFLFENTLAVPPRFWVYSFEAMIWTRLSSDEFEDHKAGYATAVELRELSNKNSKECRYAFSPAETVLRRLRREMQIKHMFHVVSEPSSTDATQVMNRFGKKSFGKSLFARIFVEGIRDARQKPAIRSNDFRTSSQVMLTSTRYLYQFCW